MQPSNTPSCQLLSGKQVNEALGISRTTRCAYVRAGVLPQPLRIVDGGRPKWRASDIVALVVSRHQQAVSALLTGRGQQ